MGGGGRCRRRRSWISEIRRRGVGAKLSIDGGGMDDILVKPDNRDRGEWICVRGHRIRRRGRMRVDANGDVYVPDSEDEEDGMAMEAGGVDLADLGGASASVTEENGEFVLRSMDARFSGSTDDNGLLVSAAAAGQPAPEGSAVGGAGVIVDGVNVATEGIAADAVNVTVEEGNGDDIKVEEDVGTVEEMHPNVVARLKMLLNHIDPTFRDVFVSMLKLKSIKVEIYSMHNMFIFLGLMDLNIF